MSSDLLPRFRQRGRSEAQWRAFGVTPQGARFPLDITAVPRRPEPNNVSIALESALREWGFGAFRAAIADLRDQARDEDGLADLSGPLPGRDPISMWAPAMVAQRSREEGSFGVDLLDLPYDNIGLTCRRMQRGAPFA